MNTAPADKHPWRAAPCGAQIDILLAHVEEHPLRWVAAVRAHRARNLVIDNWYSTAFRIEEDNANVRVINAGRKHMKRPLRVAIARAVRQAHWADNRLDNITMRNTWGPTVHARVRAACLYLLSLGPEDIPDAASRLWVIADMAMQRDIQPVPAGCRCADAKRQEGE